MPRQREEVLNGELGRLLIARHPQWNEANVHIDSTRTIRGNPSLKVDVLVQSPGGQPVAIETKFDAPGAGAEVRDQIEERIGLTVDSTGSVIEAGIAVIYPREMTAQGLEDASLRYAVLQLGEDSAIQRWPEDDSEWVTGAVGDLADAVELVSLSEKRIREGGRLLSDGVRDASTHLDAAAGGADFRANMAAVLHQAPSEQTTRMAVAIIVNAFMFHFAIEGQAGIPDVERGRGGRGFLKSSVIECWGKILDVNYWPIFSIARAVLECVPARMASPLLDRANSVAEQLLTVGATTFHDLAARMFQTLIADRKLLATFYTLPESANFLAELAVSRLRVDWADRNSVESVKVADFACGTGALLSAAQRAIYRRLRRAGLDDAEVHQAFMERVILGTDIMPSATHLTASMLSSAHPSIGYRDSLVRVLPYGTDEGLSAARHQPPETTYIGALDLRGEELGHGLFAAKGLEHGVKIGGAGMSSTHASHHDSGVAFPVEHESFDLVIMNPPFIRPTNHEAGKSEIPVPSFAGFGTSQAEQQAMSRKLRRLSKQFGHGNAGLASDFMDLAHDKIKPGGILALVLPFAFVSGRAWSKARSALSRFYSDITVISIATSGSTSRAFSADTGMAECMVLATRTERQGNGTALVRYANLLRRPQTSLEAHETAKKIERGAGLVEGSFDYSGVAGVLELGLHDVMTAMLQGRLRLPRSGMAHALPIRDLSALAGRGLMHRDINGANGRGAFDIVPKRGRRVPTYPALWGHLASRERGLVVQPDSRGEVRRGMGKRAADTWKATASRLHYNQDFRLNSQSLAACLTDQPCIGGRAWPNLIPRDESYEKPLLLWLNTTLGMMLHWWCGARQQAGRSVLTISAVPDLPVLDVGRLSAEQVRSMEQAFTEFDGRPFLPANEAYHDPVRKALDEAVLFGALGLPESLSEGLDVLRLQWCSEPSVHGGKSTHPGR